MQRTTFLRSIAVTLCLLTFVLLGHTSAYGQTTNAKPTRDITFGIETGGGIVFSGGSTQLSWGRSLNCDIEANLRIPLGTDDKFSTSVSKGHRFAIVIFLPSKTNYGLTSQESAEVLSS